jgi:hypothetical protein
MMTTNNILLTRMNMTCINVPVTSTSFRVNRVSTLNVPLECLFTDFECYARRFHWVYQSPKQTSNLALCKLHNFCIESNNGNDIITADKRDSSNIMMDGGMVLPRMLLPKLVSRPNTFGRTQTHSGIRQSSSTFKRT